MKARAKQRTFFNDQVEPNVCVLEPICFTPQELDFLVPQSRDRHAEQEFWTQFRHADTLGSLIQPDPDLAIELERHLATLDDHGDILLADVLFWAGRVVTQATYLAPRYSVVVTNPPYLGYVNMSRSMAEYLTTHLPDGKSGLDAAFISRSSRFAPSRGYVAMITMQAWMFKSSYELLRNQVLARGIACLAHLGPHAFDGQTGQVVSTCAFVLEERDHSKPGAYLALAEVGSSEEKRDVAIRAISERSAPVFYLASTEDLQKVPGAPIAYWLGARQRELYATGSTLARFGSVRKGMDTGNHDRFLRRWQEVSYSDISTSGNRAVNDYRWVPYNKGGPFRRWYGNEEYVVLWENDGEEIKRQRYSSTARSTIRNEGYFFTEGFTYSEASFGEFSARYTPARAIFDSAGASIFSHSHLDVIGALVNTVVADLFFDFLCNGNHFQPGAVSKLLVLPEILEAPLSSKECVSIARCNWDDHEDSLGFTTSPLVRLHAARVSDAVRSLRESSADSAKQLASLETTNNEIAARVYSLVNVVETYVSPARVTLTNNVLAMEGGEDGEVRFQQPIIANLVSYAVGCMFGRYSLDEPGLILADEGATVQDYLAKVPSPMFAPDADNVIPIVNGDWFEDDIVARFRTFLRAAFGEQHFEENLRFVTESLGVKDIRDYFVRSFYADHVKRYKKRPIYWLFSSPNGSFNALIYMHRYTPSTASMVLNEYLREYKAKLESSLQHNERLAAGGGTPRQQAAAQKEADRLRKVLLELDEYEHDVLYPLASQQLPIDLDDGVKVNYPKFGAALKKIPGLEASDE